jgi:hypothetical protein
MLAALWLSSRLSRAERLTILRTHDPRDVFSVAREFDSLSVACLSDDVGEVGSRDRDGDGHTFDAWAHVPYVSCKARAR